MHSKRTHVLWAGLTIATAIVPACDGSVSAPRLGPARADLSSAMELQVEDSSASAAVTTILPAFGGRIDLAARPGYPVDCTLEVPAGALDSPASFQLTHESLGAELGIRVLGRTMELQADPETLSDDPILLTLTYAGVDGTQDVAVEFSPPDGSGSVVASVTLSAGRATVLGFRRGRSKYSVIIF